MVDGVLTRAAVEAATTAVRGGDWATALCGVLQDRLDCDAGVCVAQWALGDITNSRVTSSHDPISPQRLAAIGAAMPSHPSYPLLTGNIGPAAHRVSDLVPIRQFWDTATYETVHGWVGGRYPAVLRLVATGSLSVFVGLLRRRRDFTGPDIATLQEIREPLSSALWYRHYLEQRAADWDEVFDDRLSPRERQVLPLVALGWTNTRIGHHLGITERTVRKHLDSARTKIGSRSRTEAAAWWVAHQAG